MKVVLLLFLFAISPLCHSQNERIEMRTGKFDGDNGTKVFLIDAVKSKSEYFVLYKNVIEGPGGYNYFIEGFDNELISFGKINLTNLFEKKGFYLIDLFKSKSKVHLISKRFTDYEDTYVQELDLKNLEITEPEKLFSQEINDKIFQANYDCIYSPDHETIIFHEYTNLEEKKFQTFNLHVYNSSFEKTDEIKDLKFDKGFRNDGYFDMAITNDQTIYLLVRRKHGKGLSFVFDYELITIKDGEIVSTEKIELDVHIKSIDMLIDKNNNLRISGFYGNNNDLGNDGVYHFIKKDNHKISKGVRRIFTEEFSNSQLSALEKSEAKFKTNTTGTNYAMKYLSLDELMINDDNSLTVVGEIVITYKGSGANTTVFKDYIIIRISEENSMVFSRYPKEVNKSSKTPTYSAYNQLLVFETRKLYLAEGHLKNELKGSERKLKKKQAFGITQFNPKGEKKHHILFDQNSQSYDHFIIEDDRAIFPRYLSTSEEDQVEIMGVVRQKNDVFVLVLFRLVLEN